MADRLTEERVREIVASMDERSSAFTTWRRADIAALAREVLALREEVKRLRGGLMAASVFGYPGAIRPAPSGGATDGG